MIKLREKAYNVYDIHDHVSITSKYDSSEDVTNIVIYLMRVYYRNLTCFNR